MSKKIKYTVWILGEKIPIGFDTTSTYTHFKDYEQALAFFFRQKMKNRSVRMYQNSRKNRALRVMFQHNWPKEDR